MTEKKSKVGDIKPVYQQVGFEVCKKAATKPEEEVWVATDKPSEAEIMSYQFKQLEIQED